jgi:hypothetical protein
MSRQLSASRADRGEMSLDAAMRAPSTNAPDVVVLSFLDEDVKVKEIADPKKDLWVSSIDGYVLPLSWSIVRALILHLRGCLQFILIQDLQSLSITHRSSPSRASCGDFPCASRYPHKIRILQKSSRW